MSIVQSRLPENSIKLYIDTKILVTTSNVAITFLVLNIQMRFIHFKQGLDGYKIKKKEYSLLERRFSFLTIVLI